MIAKNEIAGLDDNPSYKYYSHNIIRQFTVGEKPTSEDRNIPCSIEQRGLYLV